LFARVWGLGFWVWMLAKSCIALSYRARTVVDFHLNNEELILLTITVLLFLRIGIHKMTAWSCVLVLRAEVVTKEKDSIHLWFSPLYIGGFYAATRSRLIKAYGLVVFIAIIGFAVAHLPDPWREIVDVGVVINLFIGTVSLIVFSVTGFIIWIPWLSPNRWAKSSDVPPERFAKLEALPEEQPMPATPKKDQDVGATSPSPRKRRTPPSGDGMGEREQRYDPTTPQLMQAAALSAIEGGDAANAAQAHFESYRVADAAREPAMSLEDQFKKATDVIKSSHPTDVVSNEEKLKLYGWYKQAMDGDVAGPQPWAVHIESRRKWDAWNGCKGKRKDEAMREYVDEVERQLGVAVETRGGICDA